MEKIKIFVGCDRYQLFAVEVLAYSIRQHTTYPVEIIPLHDVQASLPSPTNPKYVARTGFSFARFAIPALVGHQGRAIYLDADMLVFADIATLWNMPFDGKKLLLQSPCEKTQKTQKKQTAVMIMDCTALDWDAPSIIAGLGANYTYEDLMEEMCILHEDQIGCVIPTHWNSLEHYQYGKTSLLHYTNMPTQPWVFSGNKWGHLWVMSLKKMLQEKVIDESRIRAEITLGNIRPSLLIELGLVDGKKNITALRRYDNKMGYMPHTHLVQPTRQPILHYIKLALQQWLPRFFAP